MPFLTVDTTVELPAEDGRAFSSAVRELYGDVMQTGTDHVAIAIRARRPSELSIGREVDGPVLVLDADIREGRSTETKREFVLAVMDLAVAEFGVPEPNLKAVITEHEGSQMMGYNRIGSDWSPDEDDST